ncbi:MAG: ABC transporter ATP-binding protein [Pirellulaceae bacterium]|nr:ABC transporter ATP-binding protein [Pirellulaceae bacterium]
MTAPISISQNSAITIDDLSMQYGDATVLDSVSCNIPAGQWVSIVGPSGCGKSTLLRCVAGLTDPTTGTVQLEGKQPAFVFQDPTLLPWRSAAGNIQLPLELEKQSTESRSDRVLQVAQLVGLEAADIDKYPRELSGGMRMRVSIARALVMNPNALLLDEPFAALDEILRQQLNQELLHIWQTQQMTVLFVTHNVAEAVYLSQRVLVLNANGTVSDDITIDLPADRVPAIRNTPPFLEKTAAVTRILQEGL